MEIRREFTVKTRPYSTQFSRSYDTLRGLGFPRLVALEAIARGYRAGLLPFSAVRENRVFRDAAYK